jgi:ABC-type branched-subunit amino acid transport system ATPase component
MHNGSALTEGTPEAVRANPAVLEAYLGTDLAVAEAE